MLPIVECIPNFSEGQRPDIIEEIAESIRCVKGVKLMHVDMGYSANRTVMTFAGAPERVIEAAFRGIEKASQLIDMSQQKGTHPRMGATDVCPLVPIQGIRFEELLPFATQLAKRVGKELHIPVYLYEKSAQSTERQNLAFIRKGGYEGFKEKIRHPSWMPDAGPQRFHPQAGQTVIGVRDFLIAYNINLDTKDVAVAREIASEIRESGRILIRDGVKQKDVDGQWIRIPGICKGVKAIGWFVDEYQLAQVSTNVTNIEVTAVHEVFEAVQSAAHRRGIGLRGSEIIGMVPKKVLLAASAHIHPDKIESMHESELIDQAISYLGLSEFDSFLPAKKVLEYQLNL